MTFIAKEDLDHGCAYAGTSDKTVVGTWDARQQRFHGFTKLPSGAIVQVKLPHIEDADEAEAFEPLSII